MLKIAINIEMTTTAMIRPMPNINMGSNKAVNLFVDRLTS
jgi:hypothetical protein